MKTEEAVISSMAAAAGNREASSSAQETQRAINEALQSQSTKQLLQLVSDEHERTRSIRDLGVVQKVFQYDDALMKELTENQFHLRESLERINGAKKC